MTTDFDVGVRDRSAMLSSGTSTLASGKYVAAAPRGRSYGTTMKRLGDALAVVPLADQVDDLALDEAELGHVGRVHEHDAALAVDAAVAIVEAVDRRVVLIVAADRHHPQPARRQREVRRRRDR